MAALTPQRHHLHGPRADPGDPPQPPPAALVIGAPQVDPSARHLPGDTCQRQRATRRRGRRTQAAPARSRRASPASGDRAGRADRTGRRRHRPSRPGAVPASHHTALDLHGALVLDQLLAHSPRERLQRLRPASHPQPRTHAHRASDQWVIREPAEERRPGHRPRPSANRIRPMPSARPPSSRRARRTAPPPEAGLRTLTTTGLSSSRCSSRSNTPPRRRAAVHAVARRQPVRSGRRTSSRS